MYSYKKENVAYIHAMCDWNTYIQVYMISMSLMSILRAMLVVLGPTFPS